MTPLSIGFALAATFVLAIALPLPFRKRRIAPELAFAVAAAFGLVAFRVSRAADWAAMLSPSGALDRLPWFVLASAGVASTVGRNRTIAGWGLAVATVAGCLWGSVYFRDVADLVGRDLIVGGGVWAALSAAALFIDRTVETAVVADPPRRFRGGWILIGSAAMMTAATVLSIVGSGSVVYGVAAGVIGVAAVGTLLGGGRLPSVLPFAMIAMTALAVAFSEMPVIAAVVLSLGWLFIHLEWRAGLFAVVLSTVTAGVLMVPLLNSIGGGGEGSGGGYGTPTEATPATDVDPFGGPPAGEPAGGGLPDPFGGSPGGP